MIIEKKVLPKYFDLIAKGINTFEIRKEDDCEYHIKDKVILKEWNGIEYTGRMIGLVITYVLRDCEGLKYGYCIFSFEVSFINDLRR